MLEVGRETVVMGVEGGGWRVEMAGPAGMGEGYGVNVHLWVGVVGEGEQVPAAGGRRNEGVCFSRIRRRVFAPQRQCHPE